MTGITKEQLQQIGRTLMEHALSKFVVSTETQAYEMTAADSTGRVWSVGDEYYRLESLDGGRYLFKGKD